MSAEATEIVSSPEQIILFIILGLLVFAALACQFFAFRHKSENWIQFVHKDSMFRNKSMAYTETGMKFIQAQKYLAIAAFLVGFLLVLVSNPT